MIPGCLASFLPIYGRLSQMFHGDGLFTIFTYIYPKHCPNVGKYSIGGASGNKIRSLWLVGMFKEWWLINGNTNSDHWWHEFTTRINMVNQLQKAVFIAMLRITMKADGNVNGYRAFFNRIIMIKH